MMNKWGGEQRRREKKREEERKGEERRGKKRKGGKGFPSEAAFKFELPKWEWEPRSWF